MLRPALVVAALLLVGCARRYDEPWVPQVFAPEAPVAPDPARRARVMAALPAAEQAFAEGVARRGLPNAAVGVVEGGALVWARGFGVADLRTGAPVTPASVFRMGSITKVFTGAALLLLRDEGKLSLDDPAAKYLPELSGVVYPTRDSPPITLRHLVTHTSGLPRVGKLSYADGHEVTEKEILAGLGGLRLEHAPGVVSSYSNLGMALAGLVVARVAEEDYESFVTRRLLAPLGMTSSGWDPSRMPGVPLAQGFRRRGDRLEPASSLWKLGAASAMGGLFSSVGDMARFAAFELAAWPPRDDPDPGPLRRGSVRESQSIAGFVPAGRQGFGVNWVVIDDPRIGRVAFHNGSTEAYCASLWLLPERGLGVVAMAGVSDAPALDAITHDLVTALAGAGAPLQIRLPQGLRNAPR
jgi:CubicO group peptidase (beta-lactamase class C family)